MPKFKRVFKPVTQERADVIADLLIRLVGETVQSKLVRAALVGAITAGSQYIQADPDEAPTPPAIHAPAATATK